MLCIIFNFNFLFLNCEKNTHTFKAEFTGLNTIVGSELNYKEFLPNGLYFTPETDELDLSIYAFYQTHLNDFDLLSSFRIGHLSIQPTQNGTITYSNLNSQEVRDRNFNYLSSSIGLRKIIRLKSKFLSDLKSLS